MGYRGRSADTSTVGSLKASDEKAKTVQGWIPYKGIATGLGRGLDEICDGGGRASLSRKVAALSIRAKERH